MLVKCPECELQVSDKAYACPHCGYPMKPDMTPRKPRNKNNKRKRLPNGFGQISEIKNRNLRNPFRAMVTVGKSSTGRPICKPLKPESFFPTYNDAYAALVEYNRNPYDLKEDITVKELYERWSKEAYKSLSDSRVQTLECAWKYCSSVYDMSVKDFRIRHVKGCIDEATVVVRDEERTPSAATKTNMKTLFNQMFDYAVEYELVDKNYARSYKLSKEVSKKATTATKEHIPFTMKELDVLWQNLYVVKDVDVVLIQCYSGWRPQEIGKIKLENVNLEERFFIGGLKTDAGKERKVPIHPKIFPLVEKRYNESKNINSKYLISSGDPRKIEFSYSKYYYSLSKIVKQLDLDEEHRPHDGRVTFTTLAKKYEIDEYAIKYMVGHEISDITEKIYTHREFGWFVTEIAKIKA